MSSAHNAQLGRDRALSRRVLGQPVAEPCPTVLRNNTQCSRESQSGPKQFLAATVAANVCNAINRWKRVTLRVRFCGFGLRSSIIGANERMKAKRFV